MTHHGRGATVLHASQADQRFSYCLYVPHSYREYETRSYPLAVIVHGTERQPQTYRDAFADFAERHQCVLLAPLFPCGVIEPYYELHNYKFIRFHDIRYDLLMLDIVAEVAAMYRLECERFLLFGFSGGGQFVHRFFYLHPNRLRAVSIGAPGWVTLLDSERDWWAGTRNFEEHFGQPLDLDTMRQTPVQMVIGGEDLDSWDVIIPEGSRYWMAGANDAGGTRIARIETLKASYEQAGIAVRLDIVPGVGHDGLQVLVPVQQFFGDVLAAVSPVAREETLD